MNVAGQFCRHHQPATPQTHPYRKPATHFFALPKPPALILDDDRQARHAFLMLLSRDCESGIERIWVTQFASVQTYFTLNQEGTGITLHMEPGFAAYPDEFKRSAEHVRHCVLDHVAERLGVLPHQVLDQPLAALRDVCDPALPDRYRYIRRARTRSR